MTTSEKRIHYVLLHCGHQTVRDLVWLLQLDKSTVCRSLNELKREGVVETRRMDAAARVWLAS